MAKPYRYKTGWAARYDAGEDPVTGKRRQRMVTGKTRKEVEAKLAAAVVARDQGTAVDPDKILLRDYLDRWLADVVVPNRTIGTAHRYRRTIKNQIKPRIGQLRLQAVTSADVARLYSTLTADGYAGSTIEGAHIVMHSALKQAVRWRLLTVNPAADVLHPKAAKKEHALWDTGMINRFRAEIAEDFYGPIFALAIVTGMRRGELLGLRWIDVDFAAEVIYIRQQKFRLLGSIHTTPPKNNHTRRIDLSAAQIEFLRWHRARQEAASLAPGALAPWNPEGLVFLHKTGKPLMEWTYYLAWTKLLERARVAYCTPHNLRHLNASLMLVAGVHPKVVQERLGHANIGITMDLYSHVAPGLSRAAAGHLDGVLADSPPPAPPAPPALPALPGPLPLAAD